jgi:hypothetical protein
MKILKLLPVFLARAVGEHERHHGPNYGTGELLAGMTDMDFAALSEMSNEALELKAGPNLEALALLTFHVVGAELLDKRPSQRNFRMPLDNIAKLTPRLGALVALEELRRNGLVRFPKRPRLLDKSFQYEMTDKGLAHGGPDGELASR